MTSLKNAILRISRILDWAASAVTLTALVVLVGVVLLQVAAR